MAQKILIAILLVVFFSLDPCDHCKMSNGAGFTRHPTDCDKFVQCYFGNNGLKKMVFQQCPWGNFWEQSSLTCKPAHRVQCPTDKCRDPEVLTYDLPGSCRSFWACDQGDSIPMCCPDGTMYAEGIGCLPDENCKDPCPPRPSGYQSPRAKKKLLSQISKDKKEAVLKSLGAPVSPSKVIPKVCDKKPVFDDPSHFEQFVDRFGWVKMPCAPGTAYDKKDCECTVRAKYTASKDQAGCKAKVKLNFTEGFEDERDKRPVYVVNNNVTFGQGVAKFEGKSRLRVPQLSNVDYGEAVVLKIKFRETRDTSNKPQAIISNGDCGNNASILVAKDADKITFGAETVGGGYTQVEIPKPNTEWKTVKYAYNDGRLQGTVNGHSRSSWIPSGGRIQARPCALQIGHGEGLGDFQGDIEDIEIFTQCFPPEEYIEDYF